MAGIELTEVEKDVLCRGLKYGIPPRLEKEKIQAEFELCWQQLQRSKSTSKLKEDVCKASLSDLGKQYSNSKIDRLNYPLKKEHLKTIGKLKRRKDIVITKPDKGNGVVLLRREDYVRKMEEILSQPDKFEKLGDTATKDRTLMQERALQALLLREKKKGHITNEEYNRIRPVGTARPRMYGVPKVHKTGAPLRPILSMENAPHYEMAKWIAELSCPVLMMYCP